VLAPGTTPKEYSKVGFLQPEPPSVNYGVAVNRGPALRRAGLVSEETIMLTGNQPLPRLARIPWNKGRLIGQKRPLKPKDVWAIRVRLQLEQRKRDLALFNLAIDSKLRGCDLVRLRVNDVCVGGQIRDRATVIQQKTGRPVQFEVTEQTRAAIRDWLANTGPQPANISSPAAFMASRTFRRDNMLGSFIAGSSAPVSPARLTGLTRCGEPKRHRFTKGRAT
jgi:integrase